MAIFQIVFYHVLFIISTFLLALLCLSDAQDLKACQFNAIYQFGDSYSDTGNLIQEKIDAHPASLPYGQTIYKATGRSSDGLIMIDYIARSAGLPFVNPYLNKKRINFRHGVNFAVAGVTALPAQVLAKQNVVFDSSHGSLNVQLQWLDSHLKELCHNVKDNCSEKLKSALFMVGEIGLNDYFYALTSNKTIMDVKKNLVPDVVKAIQDAVKRVIDYGAVRVIVPGLFHIGCLPCFLTLFKTNKLTAYDKHNCIKDFDNFAIYHNNLLQKSLEELRKTYPHVHIVYGDLYGALNWILDNRSNFGFHELHKSCCGIGGDYSFDRTFVKMCGAKSVPVCPNPNHHVSWDGEHWTQQAQKYVAKWLIRDIFPKLQCNGH